jgi:hypothetical protein
MSYSLTRRDFLGDAAKAGVASSLKLDLEALSKPAMSAPPPSFRRRAMIPALLTLARSPAPSIASARNARCGESPILIVLGRAAFPVMKNSGSLIWTQSLSF